MHRQIAHTVLIFLGLAALAHAQSRAGSPSLTGKAGLPPLVLAEQGSFFVNAQTIETRFPSGNGTPVAGHISGKGMYVQYQIPKDRRARMTPRFPARAGVAQLVEQLIRNQQVLGSSPSAGSNPFSDLQGVTSSHQLP